MQYFYRMHFLTINGYILHQLKVYFIRVYKV
jgi:hypothetical protein